MSNTNKRKRFLPENRGNIAKAVEENKLTQVAPSSPRPAVLLEKVKINSKNLTAADLALYEVLLANAYGDDQKMEAKLFSISVSEVQKFIEQASLRASLRDSLSRLASATADFKTGRYSFENAPLLVSWLQNDDEADTDDIQYSFAKPLRALMSNMKSYAYIELLALSKMKSKYSSQLYKKFALEVAQKEWKPNESNEYTVSGTPDEIGTWAGLDITKFTMSKLKERVLKFLDDDFSNVRAFSVRMHEHRSTKRGRTIERIDFILTVQPPSHFSKYARFKKGAHKELGIGAPDNPKYRVNSMIWEKVAKKFQPLKLRYSTEYAAAYFYALNEFFENDPISDIYKTAKYRGQRLLNAIHELGADEAAWLFCHEEFANPDILPFLENNKEANAEADEARIARLKALKEQQAEPIVTAVEHIEVLTSEPAMDDVEHNENMTAEPEVFVQQTYTGMTSYEEDEDAFVNSFYEDEDDSVDVDVPVLKKVKLEITKDDSFIDASLKELINYDIPEKKIPQQVIPEPAIEEEEQPEFPVSEPVLNALQYLIDGDEDDKQDAGETVEMPAEIVNLDNADEVIFTATKSADIYTLRSAIFPYFEEIPNFCTGTREVRVTLICTYKDTHEAIDFGRHKLAEEDIFVLQNYVGSYLDEEVMQPYFKK